MSFVQRLQGIIGFYLYFTFVKHGAVQVEDVDEEVIDRLALVGTEVMTLIGQVDVAHVISGTVEAVDTL